MREMMRAMRFLLVAALVLAGVTACGGDANADACQSWQAANDAFTQSVQDGDALERQNDLRAIVDDAVAAALRDTDGPVREAFGLLDTALRESPLDEGHLADAMHLLLLQCMD